MGGLVGHLGVGPLSAPGHRASVRIHSSVLAREKNGYFQKKATEPSENEK